MEKMNMPEKEAIAELQFFIEKLHNGIFGDRTGVFDVAISALEEIQQYRALGTVEEFKNCKDILSKAEADELVKIIDEWLLYRKSGTVEELKEAREKQGVKSNESDS